ncbi:MAG: hypothetical protein QM791_18660 [Ferruginibacter sp.]
MSLKYPFILAVTLLATMHLEAQHVKRKGVTPLDVTKKQGKNGAAAFSLEQFAGKWQETARTERDNNPAVITDTIMLNFPSPGKVITRDGNHSNIIGNAAIEAPGNVLIAAADVYTIVSVSPEQLVLDDQDNYIHIFSKTQQFMYETYGKNAVNQDVYTNPVSITLADVTGKWSVYRKMAKPGAINPPTNIIKYLFITEKTGDDTANGEITFYQKEKSEMLPCSVKVNNASITVSAGDYKWDLMVYKADGKEMVFGDPDVLLYYAKPL